MPPQTHCNARTRRAKAGGRAAWAESPEIFNQYAPTPARPRTMTDTSWSLVHLVSRGSGPPESAVRALGTARLRPSDLLESLLSRPFQYEPGTGQQLSEKPARAALVWSEVRTRVSREDGGERLERENVGWAKMRKSPQVTR